MDDGEIPSARQSRPGLQSVSLSSIQFHDLTVQDHFYTTLRSLRKDTLSLPNRLASLLQDAAFVTQISHKILPQNLRPLPIIANERCGSWYVPPNVKSGSAYFKSTDGHFGQWDFSLRRLNLQVLDIIEQDGRGAMIVDSTRRGKDFPDALAKTVGIWCAVVNAICFPGLAQGVDVEDQDWTPGQFQCPSGVVGEEEARRINARIPGFVQRVREMKTIESFLKSRIKRPLKCFWVSQSWGTEVIGNTEIEVTRLEKEYYAVVLCSASRRVHGAEMSEGGYIQGAGDDAEAWAKGLTPDIFWENKEVLLNADGESGLDELVQRLVEQRNGSRRAGTEAVLVKPTRTVFVGKNGSPLDDSSQLSAFDITINCHGVSASLDPLEEDASDGKASTTLDLRLPNHSAAKMASRELRKKFGLVKDFISYHFTQGSNPSLLITCETGRDLSVGVALVILCLYFDEEGMSPPSEIFCSNRSSRWPLWFC